MLDSLDTPRPSKRALERERFLEAHPKCCFCSGERPTVEVDHVPARICFKNSIGPEGFEFPACSQCNRTAAHSEQVTALYFRFTEHNSDNWAEEDFLKLFRGVANNSPEAVPMLDSKTSRLLAMATPGDRPGRPGALIIPNSAHKHMELFATKILYALYYRVSGRLAGPHQRRLIIWAQAGTPAANSVHENAEAWFGDLNAGSRTNIDLGDQFRFRHGYNETHGFFGLSMSFGQALVFFCVLGPGKQMKKLKGWGEMGPRRYQPIWMLGNALKPRST